MGKDFDKELKSYLSKRTKKHRNFFKLPSRKAKETFAEEYDEFAGVSPTQMTILEKEETVWDKLKKTAHDLVAKVPVENVPAFDEQGNALDKNEYEQHLAQSENVLQKGGKLVTNIFSKLDVFDITGKKSTAAAQAEFAELKEFGEVIQTGEDVKELARISANILRLLPPEKLEEFKRGSDFKSYKDILKKHQIIK